MVAPGAGGCAVAQFSVKYYLNLVLVDEEDRRYFKQQATLPALSSSAPPAFAFRNEKEPMSKTD